MQLSQLDLVRLKQHGFKWYKDCCTDRVDAEYISDVTGTPLGIVVTYNENSVLRQTIAIVDHIEWPSSLSDGWIMVHYDECYDIRRPGK
jgi:hypothetical protein